MDLARMLTRGGEGVKNPENLADVICERPPTGVDFMLRSGFREYEKEKRGKFSLVLAASSNFKLDA